MERVGSRVCWMGNAEPSQQKKSIHCMHSKSAEMGRRYISLMYDSDFCLDIPLDRMQVTLNNVFRYTCSHVQSHFINTFKITRMTVVI